MGRKVRKKEAVKKQTVTTVDILHVYTTEFFVHLQIRL